MGIKIPKESLEGPKRIPPGIYTIRFDGFNPEYTKKGESINYLPDLKIINNPDLQDRRPGKEWLNSKAGWVLLDFVHCFGLPTGNPDDPEIPGDFVPPGEKDVKKWKYQGPLLGRTGQVEIGETYGNDNSGPYPGIKRYLCAVPGCTIKHTDNLFKK